MKLPVEVNPLRNLALSNAAIMLLDERGCTLRPVRHADRWFYTASEIASAVKCEYQHIRNYLMGGDGRELLSVELIDGVPAVPIQLFYLFFTRLSAAHIRRKGDGAGADHLRALQVGWASVFNRPDIHICRDEILATAMPANQRVGEASKLH